MNASLRVRSLLGSAIPFLCVGSMIASVLTWGTVPFQTAHFGDDQEYLTMTTSFMRHGGPDFVAGDDTEMLGALPRKWRRTLGKKFTPGQPPYAYYESKARKFYGWHFFVYPALVVPARTLLDGQPEAFRAHQFTNLIVFCAALLSLLQLRKRPVLFWSLAPLAFFTPVLWFLTYASTESVVFSLGLISLTCHLSDRRLVAILFNSIAAMQYQPLSLLSLFLFAHWLWTERHDLRRQVPRVAFGAAAAALVFVPGVFYYLNYGTPNLIAREHLASPRFVTFSKIADLFVDLNGGMLVFTPGLLLLLLLAAGSASFRLWRERDGFSLALFGCVVLVMIGSTVQRNWNHPTFGVSRYVVYSIAPVLLFLGVELRRRAVDVRVLAGLVTLALGLALLVHRANGFFSYRSVDSAHHTPAALFVLERWPALYAPHPEIFCERTVGRCWTHPDTGLPLSEHLPAIWRDSQGRARKILTECDEAKLLQAAAWSETERAEIRAAMAACTGGSMFYVNL